MEESDDLKKWVGVTLIALVIICLILMIRFMVVQSNNRTNACMAKGGAIVSGTTSGCFKLIPISLEGTNE